MIMFKRNKKIGFTSVFLAVIVMTVTAAINASANASVFF